MFNYQEYRNKYSQHIMFYEAGVNDRQRVYNARVAVIGVGRIGIEAARLLTIAHVQLLRFIHWGEAATEGTTDHQAPLQETLPSGMAAVQDLAAANPSLALELVDATEVADFIDLLQDIDLVLYEDGDQGRSRSLSQSQTRHEAFYGCGQDLRPRPLVPGGDGPRLAQNAGRATDVHGSRGRPQMAPPFVGRPGAIAHRVKLPPRFARRVNVLHRDAHQTGNWQKGGWHSSGYWTW